MACPLHKHVSAGTGVVSSPKSRSMLSLGARGQRAGRVACVANAFESSSRSSTATTTRSVAGGTDTIRVKVSPPREVSQPPAPPSLIHSPVYVQKALIKSPTDSPTSSASSSSLRIADVEDEQDAGSSNSLLWALKQVDRSLDELEQNPLPLQKEIYELSRSPVGTATSSALTTAAKVTVAATKEAVKAALPVGQWMVKEGAKAAFSLMSKAVAETSKAQQQQRPGGTGTTVMKTKQVKDGGKKRK